jgi:phosphate transport system substrate-binding protein
MFSNEDVSGYEYGLPKKASKTVPSYKRLIDKEVDLIIVPDPSQEVKDLAAKANVKLEYIPIGAEALVFITPKDNPVSNISIAQVNKIYTDMSITNWSKLGGKDGRIVPICRNNDSGSQSQFNNIVLRKNQLVHPVIQKNYLAEKMGGMLGMVESYESFAKGSEKNAFTLGYTPYYYLQLNKSADSDEPRLKILSIDNIAPTPQTILSKHYPLAINYFAVIRKDTAKDHPARKIAGWLTTDGQLAVAHSGLGALKALK